MSRVLASPDRFAVSAFDALLANIAILDREGVIIAVNLAWAQFAQQHGGPGADLPSVQDTRDGSIGLNYLAVCDGTTGEDRRYALQIARQIRTVLMDGPSGGTEYPCRLPDGLHYFMARVSGFTQDGERYAVVAHEDITRRKLAELEVVRLNRDLEARVEERGRQLTQQNHALAQAKEQLEANVDALVQSNLALAQYAHVASHDLQEPLRIVGAYSDMLRHRYGQTLDPRAHGYLNHITDQVTRARQMVRDVLAYASVSSEPPLEELDLEPLWTDAAHYLTWPEGTQVTVSDLPHVQANVAQMKQLFGNLLGNSLKFRAGHPLRVHLGVASGQAAPAGFVELVVRDNGVGIRADAREQVFGMFQRLHARGAQGGNGIGLAVCRRIVESHGGRIWIGEPQDGAGTAIHFTLPLAGHHHSAGLP